MAGDIQSAINLPLNNLALDIVNDRDVRAPPCSIFQADRI